jgi:hypothetical protein
VVRLGAPALARVVDELLDAEEECVRARELVFAALPRDEAGTSREAMLAARRARKRLTKGKLPEDLAGVAEAEVATLRAAMDRRDGARARIAASFDEGRQQVTRALREVATDARFREAVTWQNARAIGTGLDMLLGCNPERMDSSDRRHEELVANYLHRYAAKNDSIGFFGPIGWARLDPAEGALACRPGPSLLARRGVHFEQWGIDKVAAMLSGDERIRHAIAPRRFGFVRIDGNIVHSAMSGRLELPGADAIVLAACDGTTAASTLATELSNRFPAELPTVSSVFAALEALQAKQLIAWSLELGMKWEPETELLRRIEQVADAGVRGEAVAVVRDLLDARSRVASAAGDAAAVGSALAELDATFVRLTGAAAARHSGEMYASRTLVFEDCRRDIEMTVGPRLLADIGPALSLVLQSARWFTSEVGDVYAKAFRDLYDDIARRTGSTIIPFADFWFRSKRLLHGASTRPLDPLAASLRARWAEVFGPETDARRTTYESATLAPRVAQTFAASTPPWAAGRYHSPDLLFAASSVEAVERGDYLAVLGELHLAMNTLGYWALLAQHPSPQELIDTFAGHGRPRVRFVRSKDISRLGAVRLGNGLFGPQDYEIEAGLERSTLPPDRVLRIADLVLGPSSAGLVVRSVDGRVEFPLFDVMGGPLGEAIAQIRELWPGGEHASRLTIDRLVVRRESWRFPASKVSFAFETSEDSAFVEARRWARAHGMPRFVFVSSPLEGKPVFVDFEGIVSLRIASKIARKATEDVGGERSLTFTEMLPSLEDVWLPDADGNRYTSELRVLAVDQLGGG